MIIRLAALALFPILSLSGCFSSLPSPTLRETTLPPSTSYEQICSNGLTRAVFTFHDGSKLSGIVQCTDTVATIVLFNSFNLRVRTTTLSRDGHVRDEISYLSPYDDAAEALITELCTALHAKTRPDSGKKDQLTISARE